jgi:phospholipase C
MAWVRSSLERHRTGRRPRAGWVIVTAVVPAYSRRVASRLTPSWSALDCSLTRREMLGGGLRLAGAGALAAYGGRLSRVFPAIDTLTAPAGSDLGAVEHVLFLMQENRSFDHYFGTYRGVRGFADQSAGASGRFHQPWPGGPSSTLLPFHLTAAAQTICAGSYSAPDIEWATQHAAWANGRVTGFLTPEGQGAAGAAQAPLVMSYLNRQDLPYYYALADAFTICDRYHCSVLGPTMPNRLYWFSGTIDPNGRNGGPVVTTPAIAQGSAALGACDWLTMPEVLLDHGVNWKVYQPAGTGTMSSAPSTSFNALTFFKQYTQNPSGPLYQRGLEPTWPDEFNADVASGQLPPVSWVLPPLTYSEHPSNDAQVGEWFISQVLAAVMANKDLWSKTVIFLTYDENGGFFDHVPPPTPPKGTPGEAVTVTPTVGDAAGFRDPIGLGFRVPTMVISPWSRGGYVDSHLYDHTSMLRFLEQRFGVTAPNVSAWRRRTVGDLTSTLRFSRADSSTPTLPATSSVAEPGCPTPTDVGPFFGPAEPITVPSPQRLPGQEQGTARRR